MQEPDALVRLVELTPSTQADDVPSTATDCKDIGTVCCQDCSSRLWYRVVRRKRSVASIAKLIRYATGRTSLPQDLLRSLEAGVSGADHSTESRITLHRALLVTLEIAKLLVTNRSARGRMLMGQLAEPLFGPVVSVHERELAAAEQQLSSGGTHPSGIEDIELALLCFKIASRLALYGWRDPYSVEAPKVCCPLHRERSL